MTIYVGAKNLITDIAGIKIGHAHDKKLKSGVTVILPDEPVTAGVDIRGGAPGARETALLSPTATIEQIHALAFSGGSAWGLAAGDGVMQQLKAWNRGFRWKSALIPLVPTSIIFDLLNGGDKDWVENPYISLAQQATNNADDNFALGRVGAGYGAKVGTMTGAPLKGGVGSASLYYDGNFHVGALVIANPLGTVLSKDGKYFLAAPYERGGEFGDFGLAPALGDDGSDWDYPFENFMPDLTETDDIANMANTTIAVIATDLALNKVEATRIAMAAHDGMARAIRPVHTALDGDTIYVISTNKKPVKRQGDMARCAMMAGDCLARAIARGVYEANPTLQKRK